MKQNLIVATILGLLASGTGAAALQCTVPAGASYSNGPFLPFTQLISCSNGAGVIGFGKGDLATASNPKRICVALDAGVDAYAQAFDGQFGQIIPSCTKHDSTVNGSNRCTTGVNDCTAATHQALIVKN